MWEAADVLIKAAIPLTTSDTKTVSEWTRQMATLPQASNLATRILLLTLLFEVRTSRQTHRKTSYCSEYLFEVVAEKEKHSNSFHSHSLTGPVC